MKLVLVIINEDIKDGLVDYLNKHNYQATIIGSNGSFVQYGDSIIMIGTDSSSVEQLIDLIDSYKDINDYDNSSNHAIYVLDSSIYHIKP
ncbi:MAG: cyclic-di-AMP receptor [Erysipelotrichaceae bacterium]